jgi:hypothetical protein
VPGWLEQQRFISLHSLLRLDHAIVLRALALAEMEQIIAIVVERYLCTTTMNPSGNGVAGR